MTVTLTHLELLNADAIHQTSLAKIVGAFIIFSLNQL